MHIAGRNGTVTPGHNPSIALRSVKSMGALLDVTNNFKPSSLFQVGLEVHY
jgi:hypothetical protein